MTERNNDISEVNLWDIVGNYTPQNQLSVELVEKFCVAFGIAEDADTVITGNYRDWILFLSFILDKYCLSKLIDFDIDLTHLDPVEGHKNEELRRFVELISQTKLTEDHSIGFQGKIGNFEKLLVLFEKEKVNQCLNLLMSGYKF